MTGEEHDIEFYTALGGGEPVMFAAGSREDLDRAQAAKDAADTKGVDPSAIISDGSREFVMTLAEAGGIDPDVAEEVLDTYEAKVSAGRAAFRSSLGAIGLDQEQLDKAVQLRWRHADWAKSLEGATDTYTRAQMLRDRQAQGEELPYQEACFANGEILQRQMIGQAALHYDAIMWRAQQHYLQNQEAYQEQAILDAAAAGYQTSFGSTS